MERECKNGGRVVSKETGPSVLGIREEGERTEERIGKETESGEGREWEIEGNREIGTITAMEGNQRL
jgi:hypothetical protein